jgi:hypothetical protein
MEDWQVVVNLAVALGVRFDYTSAAHVRADLEARRDRLPALEGISRLAFNPPVSARTWLQTSNPSERWKWDFMFQDLPPVKFQGEPFSTNFASVIPLKEVK